MKKKANKEGSVFWQCMIITEVDDLEILGVTVDSKLTWNKHISNISSRARQILGALRRIASKLDARGRATVYIQGPDPKRDGICFAVLDEHLNNNTSILDRIQQKALQIIGLDSGEACANFNIPSLHHRCRVAAAIVLYRMHTSHCPADLKRLLPPPFQTRKMTCSSLSIPSYALEGPKSRTQSTGRSFTHVAIKNSE